MNSNHLRKESRREGGGFELPGPERGCSQRCWVWARGGPEADGSEGLASEGLRWTLKGEIEFSRPSMRVRTSAYREARLGGQIMIQVWMCGLPDSCESPGGCMWEAGGPSEKPVSFLPYRSLKVLLRGFSERRDPFEGSRDCSHPARQGLSHGHLLTEDMRNWIWTPLLQDPPLNPLPFCLSLLRAHAVRLPLRALVPSSLYFCSLGAPSVLSPDWI